MGSTSAGGYLVETTNFPSAAQSLLSLLVLGCLGCTALDADIDNMSLAKVNTSAAAYWLPTELTQITESELAPGQANFAPRIRNLARTAILDPETAAQ